jgi:hypothetical protein
VFHLRRPALAGIAAIGLLAAACSGSSATPTPTPISDPQVLIGQSLGQAPTVTSFHFKVDLSGKVNTSALSSASGGIGLGGTLDLAGTSVEGDVDVKNQAAHVKLSAPGLLGLTGEAIVVNGDAYYKISLQGDKFTKVSLSSLMGGLPISVPSALPSGSGDLTDQVAQLRQQLQAAGVTATMMPDDTIGGKPAYHVKVNLPLDKINAALASSGSDSTANMKLDSIGLDYWAYKDTLLPAKVEIQGSAASAGNLDVVVTITDYNKPVTITAPDPSQIQG